MTDQSPPADDPSPKEASRDPVRTKPKVTESRDADSMPTEDNAKLQSEKPAMDKPSTDMITPQPDKPQTEKPKEEAKPSESKAGPEEAAAVKKALKAVRSALASRDLPKAKDLLDEATIEASASDSLAAVKRTELLTNYVENFWDAARKTLPKLQAAETIEIDGDMLAVVEADEEHLIVRSEGRNREFAWRKIPHKIAYYLADRWLAKNDAVRNLVLASFQMVEPKGDLNQAQALLDAAASAGVDAEPLVAELKVVKSD